MADDEYEMEWDQGSDQEQQNGSEGAIEIENNFYEAENDFKSDPQSALEKFMNVVLLEETRGETNYSFRALKNAVVLAMQLRIFDSMIEN
jgi:hypothetical protein